MPINYKTLAEQGYIKGRDAAKKHLNDPGYDKSWSEIPESARVGYIAFTKFIIRKTK